MTQRSGTGHAVIPHPGPALTMLCCCGWEHKPYQKGQVWRQLLEQTHVPALPLYSTHGYSSGAWNKSYSVLAVVSKAAATGCSSCLLLEKLLHQVRWCWELSQLLAVQLSGWTLSFSSAIASMSSAQLMPGLVDLLWHWPSSHFQHTTKPAVCCGLENSQQREGNSRQGKRSQWHLCVLCQQGCLPPNITRQEMWLCKRQYIATQFTTTAR